jgi:hypothetical protein
MQHIGQNEGGIAGARDPTTAAGPWLVKGLVEIG